MFRLRYPRRVLYTCDSEYLPRHFLIPIIITFYLTVKPKTILLITRCYLLRCRDLHWKKRALTLCCYPGKPLLNRTVTDLMYSIVWTVIHGELLLLYRPLVIAIYQMTITTNNMVCSLEFIITGYSR